MSVFGCTDDNAGRMVLSRLASYLLTPVIDCGVLLSSGPSGLLEGINGRVTVLAPGAACLVCRGRIDQARAATELLTPEERARRLDEGYATALPGTEPAVVTFTTAVAAAAVTELLERLIGFGPEPVPSELILRLHDREVSANRQAPRAGPLLRPGRRQARDRPHRAVPGTDVERLSCCSAAWSPAAGGAFVAGGRGRPDAGRHPGPQRGHGRTPAAPKWLAFDCPCRTGHQIMLNLDRRRTPYWTVTNTRRLTVSPSIDSYGPGRRCHYFVRQEK